MTHTYMITGMTCSSCLKKVQGLLAGVPGIKNISIDLATGKATAELNKHISTDILQAALKDYPKYQISEETVKPVVEVYNEEPEKSWLATYRPLLLLFGFITAVSLIAAKTSAGFNPWEFMRVFMAGFFVSFSFFKMLDIRGFADSYSMYDIVAKRFRAWGYIYPFVELILGLSFAANIKPWETNAITLVIMLVSIIGVLQSVLNKRKIRCACLGAVFSLPMSTVTIIEDSVMIIMSAVMLVKML
jgi:copper chaperone CopZ